MFKYYLVNNKWQFSQHIDAITFAKQVDGTIKTNRYWNPFKQIDSRYQTI